MSDISLEGMHIFISGGLGSLATAFGLQATEAGARITVADVDADSTETQRAVFARYSDRGNDVPAMIALDVTDAEQCRAAMHANGVPDVVINFAGVHHAPMDLALEKLNELAAAFDRVVRVNLTGAFLVTAAAAQAMTPRRSGHIIHLCSNGSRASLYGSYGYNASKHGVEGLVKTAAAQLAPLGLRVNGVAPGTVITNLNRALSFDEEGRPKPRARSILAHTPTKRFATAEGVAKTILAMCYPQPHFTGNVVFCDDGYNIEGHSWPEGNMALYEHDGEQAVDRLYDELDRMYPRHSAES